MFIEMNPRIQVEHTVTEEVTDVDLVQSQLRIASGETLDDLGLHQDSIVLRGAALQCRITTEDPANNFRPDTGRITTYRSPGGAGIRLDGGTTYTGAEISPHFDSMLAKLTCRGRTFDKAVERARRALAEFRIRGVSTNIAFLQALLDDPDFQAGHVTTSFIETHPQLLTARASGDRGTKLLTYLADVTVNQPYGPAPVSLDPVSKLPHVDLSVPAPDGTRQAAAGPRARRRSRRRCATRTESRSPTPPSATRTSRSSPPGCAPMTCSPSPGTSPGPPRSCGRWRPGAERRTTWRCASSPRTRGSGWPSSARRCRTSACRCCCAGATRSATRRTPPTSRRRSSRRPRPPAWTCSGSSTRSTTSSRCGPPSRRCCRRARRSPRSRSATPATCPTRASGSTPSTTTSGSPRASSSRARTCWRSRTWPGCCGRRRPGPW